MYEWKHGGPGLLVLSLLLAAAPAIAGGSSGAMTTEAGYSDKTFRELVARYAVDDGESVDYAAWKDSPEDLAALDRQVELIARISPKSHPEQFPTANAARSYWINTYNTLVLAAVLELWPLDSVRDVKPTLGSRLIAGKGFFYDRKVTVGGGQTNLFKLEKEVLRSQKDPRLHFALNCGSESCPLLRPWEWSDDDLDRAAREFVNNPDNVAVEDEIVHLSKIFKWYKRDFPREIYAYLQQYAEPDLETRLQAAIDGRYRKRYRDYDWSLNDADRKQELAGDGH